LFFSGQELKQEEQYEPLVPALPEVSPATVNDEDKVPHILATGLRIGNEKDAFVFKCLLDSGDTDPMINL
jgi:hypothetical protein